METKHDTETRGYIRGAALRKRWGDMARSTFNDRLKAGKIPEPIYPFGPDVPYWEIETVMAFEAAAKPIAA